MAQYHNESLRRASLTIFYGFTENMINSIMTRNKQI